MSQEFTCEGCRKARLVEPPQDKFGEVTLIKFDGDLYSIKVDEALGNTRYEVLGKQREYICDKCVLDARKNGFGVMGLFYALLLAVTWLFDSESVIQLVLISGILGTIIYFMLRSTDIDIRDQILKNSLKKLGKTPVTRKESKYL